MQARIQTIDAVLIDLVGCLAESCEGAIFEDVVPALAELKSMGVQLVICSALAEAAVSPLVKRLAPVQFDAVFCGGNFLLSAVQALPFDLARIMFLTATAEGLSAARDA